jgi:hypothetical protein
MPMNTQEEGRGGGGSFKPPREESKSRGVIQFTFKLIADYSGDQDIPAWYNSEVI